MAFQSLSLRPADGPLKTAIAACKTHLAYAAAFSALINLLYIAPTIYMLQVYDRVIPTRGTATLAFLTLLLLASLAALALLDMVRSRLLVRASARLERTLSSLILSASLEHRQTDNNPQSMREFDALRQTISGAGVLALFDAPWIVVYVGLCFVLSPWLGLMAVLGAAALVGLTLATERATRPALLEANQAAAWSYASQAQSSAARDLIRALGMRSAVVAGHQNERTAMIGLQAEASFSAGRYMAVTRFVRLSLQSLALGVAAYLAVGQQISAGAIFAASLLISRALSPIEQVLGCWKQLEEARNAYGRLAAILKSAGSAVIKTRLPAPAGRLMLESVTVASPNNERLLLKNVSFALAPGEVMGVVGKSGAGKSTLIRAVVGASPLERGAVRLDGASLSDWDSDLLGRHIGYLPQEIGLFHGTIKQNICRFRDRLSEPGDDIDAKVITAAKACGAHDMILRLPNGYDTLLDWNGHGVSLGQAQRIALARALFDEPRIIALDEPNAHLDADGEAALSQAISAMRSRGAAILIVAHRSSLLDIMDKLLVLSDGQVVDQGRRMDVLRRLQGVPMPSPATEREVA